MRSPFDGASHPGAQGQSIASFGLVFPDSPECYGARTLDPEKMYETIFDVTGHLKLPGTQESTIANGIVSGVGPWTSADGKEFTSSAQKDGSHWVLRKAKNGTDVLVLNVKNGKTIAGYEVAPNGDFRKLPQADG